MRAVRRALSSQAGILLGGAALLLAAYLALAIDAAHHRLLPLDGEVRDLVQPLRSPTLDLGMEMVSFLGEPGGLIPLILMASALLWRISRRCALLLPLLMAGTDVLQRAAKWAAARPRPNTAPWGFPSGHVLSLAVFFGIVAFLLIALAERGRRFRLVACGSCALAVGLVASSRIYLDKHWLSDVVGGFTLGVAYLLIAIYLSQRLFGAALPGRAARAVCAADGPPAERALASGMARPIR